MFPKRKIRLFNSYWFCGSWRRVTWCSICLSALFLRFQKVFLCSFCASQNAFKQASTALSAFSACLYQKRHRINPSPISALSAIFRAAITENRPTLFSIERLGFATLFVEEERLKPCKISGFYALFSPERPFPKSPKGVGYIWRGGYRGWGMFFRRLFCDFALDWKV